MGALTQDQIAAQMAGSGLTEQGVLNQAAADAVKTTPFADKLSAGFNAATASPQAATSFLKDNAKNLMYAAGPAVMAGANVESKLPQTVTRPGMIRPYTYDPYGGTYAAGVPYEATARAAGGGLMGMADGGYNPGVLDFAQRSEPVVRMASGGIAAFDNGGFVTGGGGYTPEQMQRFIAIKAAEDKAAAEKLAAYTPSDPILAPMLAQGVKGMLHGETDEQAYNRIKQMDMEEKGGFLCSFSLIFFFFFFGGSTETLSPLKTGKKT